MSLEQSGLDVDLATALPVVETPGSQIQSVALAMPKSTILGTGCPSHSATMMWAGSRSRWDEALPPIPKVAGIVNGKGLGATGTG